jgi:hypothetical protein
MSLAESTSEFFEFIEFLMSSKDLGTLSTLGVLSNLSKVFLHWLLTVPINILTFQWLGWLVHLPTLKPHIAHQLAHENYILTPTYQAAQLFTIDLPARAVGGLNKFGLGIMNSLWIVMPITTASLLSLRRFVLEGFSYGVSSAAGSIIGELIFIGCVVFGCQDIIARWYALGPITYLIGFFFLWRIINKEFHITPLTRKEYPKVNSVASWVTNSRCQECFWTHLALAWTEQAVIFYRPFHTPFSWEQISVLQHFPTSTPSEYLIIHISYMAGLAVGACLLVALWSFLVIQFKNFVTYREQNAAPISVLGVKMPKMTLAIWGDILLVLTMALSITTLPYYAADNFVLGSMKYHTKSEYLSQTLLSDDKKNKKYKNNPTYFDRGSWQEDNNLAINRLWKKKFRGYKMSRRVRDPEKLPEPAPGVEGSIRTRTMKNLRVTTNREMFSWRKRLTDYDPKEPEENFFWHPYMPQDAWSPFWELDTKPLWLNGRELKSQEMGEAQVEFMTYQTLLNDVTKAQNYHDPVEPNLTAKRISRKDYLKHFNTIRSKPDYGADDRTTYGDHWDQVEYEDYAKTFLRNGSTDLSAPAPLEPKVFDRLYKRPWVAEHLKDRNEFNNYIQDRIEYGASDRAAEILYEHDITEAAIKNLGLDPPKPDSMEGQDITDNAILSLDKRAEEKDYRAKINYQNELAEYFTLKYRPSELVRYTYQAAPNHKMTLTGSEESREELTNPEFKQLLGQDEHWIKPRKEVYVRNYPFLWGWMTEFESGRRENLLYRLALNLYADNLLARQPNIQFQTEEDQNRLEFQRLLLSRYHRSLRAYRETAYYGILGPLMTNAKSDTSYVFRQQFAGNRRIARRLFFVNRTGYQNPYSESISSMEKILPYEEGSYQWHQDLDPDLRNIYVIDKDKDADSEIARFQKDALIPQFRSAPFYMAWDESLKKLVLTTGRVLYGTHFFLPDPELMESNDKGIKGFIESRRNRSRFYEQPEGKLRYVGPFYEDEVKDPDEIKESSRGTLEEAKKFYLLKRREKDNENIDNHRVKRNRYTWSIYTKILKRYPAHIPRDAFMQWKSSIDKLKKMHYIEPHENPAEKMANKNIKYRAKAAMMRGEYKEVTEEELANMSDEERMLKLAELEIINKPEPEIVVKGGTVRF